MHYKKQITKLLVFSEEKYFLKGGIEVTTTLLQAKIVGVNSIFNSPLLLTFGNSKPLTLFSYKTKYKYCLAACNIKVSPFFTPFIEDTHIFV